MNVRILIDCSKIDFNRQPTGIPRVVLQYIECGYRWAATTGVEVIPVVTTPAGPVLVRPLPGAKPPKRLLESVNGDAMPLAIDRELELASFHLQSALLAANQQPTAARCGTEVRHAFQRLVDEASLPVIKSEPGDILFCPAYWHDVPPRYFRWMQQHGCRVATLVHDVLPITHGNFYQAPWKHEFEANLISAMRHSDALFAVSGATAASMREIAERNGLGMIKVDVAYNGYQPLISDEMRETVSSGQFRSVMRSNARYELISRTQPFLMVGSVEPKKGHIPVLRCLEALWNSGFERPLVVVGRKGWLEASVVHAIASSPYFNDKLFWFEDFDDLDLAFAYHNSRGLIFASYAEGFGIPMIEALKAGRPVVGYDTPINREVLGDHGLIFDDFRSLAGHLLQLDDDAGFANACAHAATFNWPCWDELASTLFASLVDRFALNP